MFYSLLAHTYLHYLKLEHILAFSFGFLQRFMKKNNPHLINGGIYNSLWQWFIPRYIRNSVQVSLTLTNSLFSPLARQILTFCHALASHTEAWQAKTHMGSKHQQRKAVCVRFRWLEEMIAWESSSGVGVMVERMVTHKTLTPETTVCPPCEMKHYESFQLTSHGMSGLNKISGWIKRFP